MPSGRRWHKQALDSTEIRTRILPLNQHNVYLPVPKIASIPTVITPNISKLQDKSDCPGPMHFCIYITSYQIHVYKGHETMEF